MKKEKLYFKDINSTVCYELAEHLNEAISDGLKKVTLLEAIPDNNNSDYVYCGHAGEVQQRSECKKKYCNHYKSTSGRGKCSLRGNLYQHGDEITFKI